MAAALGVWRQGRLFASWWNLQVVKEVSPERQALRSASSTTQQHHEHGGSKSVTVDCANEPCQSVTTVSYVTSFLAAIFSVDCGIVAKTLCNKAEPKPSKDGSRVGGEEVDGRFSGGRQRRRLQLYTKSKNKKTSTASTHRRTSTRKRSDDPMLSEYEKTTVTLWKNQPACLSRDLHSEDQKEAVFLK
eukprot:scaffold3614_cov94-Skeletonema_menzelii.AAC.1